MLSSVLLYALLPVAAAVIGATISAFHPPGPKLRSMIQHFAAGVVFSVVAVELLPDIVRNHRPLQVVIGFALGVVAMLVVRAFTGHGDESKETKEAEIKLPLALLAAVGVDLLIDGFLVGLGFAAGAKEGKLLTLALTMELLSLGLAVCVTLHKASASRAKALSTTAGISLLIVVGAGRDRTDSDGEQDRV